MHNKIVLNAPAIISKMLFYSQKQIRFPNYLT